MAYNDKTLKTDLEGKPIPQAFSDSVGDFEAIKSTNGALHQVLYGANGLPISIVNNKLAVRATEIEALLQGFATEGKLEQVRALLQNVSDKDFAKDETLEQARTLLEAISTKDFATSSKQDALNIAVEDLKDAISGKDFATQTTLAAVLAKLADLESELATIKANQLSGDQKVQLSGTIKLETIRTSALTITPGSTIELLAPREVDVNYSSVIINMDVSATESSLVDGGPVVYYESARVIEFTATNRYRTTVPTVFYGEPTTSTGYSSKKMPVTGPFERIRVHNPSSTRDMSVRSVGLTYYRGL